MSSASDSTTISEIEKAIDLAEFRAYHCCAPVIFALGLFGTLANFIILRNPKFSARFYVYLKGLSFADLGFLCFAIPFVANILKNHEDDGIGTDENYSVFYYRVHFEMPIVNGFVGASFFIVVCMTLDR